MAAIFKKGRTTPKCAFKNKGGPHKKFVVIGDFGPYVEEIQKNLQLIEDHKDIIRQLSMKDPCDVYIKLHHSKHKEFIDSVKKLHDVNKNLDQYKAAREAQNLDVPRLNAFLQQQESVFRKNVREVNELERRIDRLDSCAETNVHESQGA